MDQQQTGQPNTAPTAQKYTTIFITSETRDRFNQVKQEMSLAEGRRLNQDEALQALLARQPALEAQHAA